jgi:hypothetical protein
MSINNFRICSGGLNYRISRLVTTPQGFHYYLVLNLVDIGVVLDLNGYFNGEDYNGGYCFHRGSSMGVFI